MYLEQAPDRIDDLLLNACQPMFLGSVFDQVTRLTGFAQRKPRVQKRPSFKANRALSSLSPPPRLQYAIFRYGSYRSFLHAQQFAFDQPPHPLLHRALR